MLAAPAFGYVGTVMGDVSASEVATALMLGRADARDVAQTIAQQMLALGDIHQYQFWLAVVSMLAQPRHAY